MIGLLHKSMPSLTNNPWQKRAAEMTKNNSSPPSHETSTYEVGYKKPPAKNRFQPGKSGNPSGRRAKHKGPDEYLLAMMTKHIAVSENGVSKKMTRTEALMRRIFSAAMKGDSRAFETIIKIMAKRAAEEKAQEVPLDLSILTDEELEFLSNVKKRMAKAQMDAEIESVKKKHGLSE